MNNETLQQLADAIAQRMLPQPQPASQAAPVTAPQAGQPAPISWAPAPPMWGWQPQGPVHGPMPQLQPTGVSVPVTIPMPDGRELSVRVHFGPEVLQNQQALVAYCMQVFGPYLQARGRWNGWQGWQSRYPRR